MLDNKQSNKPHEHRHSALPEGWRIIELGKCSKVERGRFAHRPRNAPQFYGGNMPFVQTGDVSNSGGFIRKYTQTLNALGCSISKIFPKGTILITIAANIGDCGILEFESACPDSLIAITPQSNLDTRYLTYFLHTQKPRIHYLAPQGAQKNINVNFLDQLPIVVPPLKEQQRIAEVLLTWDTAIEKTENLIAAKIELKKGLMQQLLLGKKRFQEFVDQEWGAVPLGKVFREVKDTNDGYSHHSIMTISSRLGLISQEDKFDRVIAGDSLKKYIQLKRGDFAYNKGNSKSYEMGCIYQLEDRESALVPFVYICFRPTDAIYPEFYKHWFLAHGLDRQLKKIITSGARSDGLLNVNTDDFFKLNVPLPSKDEQTAIAQIFQALDKEIILLQEKRDALKKQKRGLMQQLLTGKKRVKVDEQAGREAVAI